MKKYRVIQYGAGNTGKFALNSILSHPALELVGLGVHSQSKEGVDAGALCRQPPTGILATRDLDALFSLEADCVSFMPTDPHAGDVLQAGSQSAAMFDLLCAFLASGKNVIATAPNALVHAPSLGKGIMDRLESACRAGNASFHYVGVSPGFMPDRLILNLTAISSRIESIDVREIMNYGEYDDPAMLFDFYGFGRPPGFDPAALRDSFARTLGGSVALVADGLALDLDEIVTDVEFATADRDIDIRTGTVQKGSTGAVWIKSWGIVANRPRIKVEHVTRIADDVAPHWPRFDNREGGEGYCIEIHGAPSMRVEVALGAFGRNPMADAGWAVGGHLSNAIPSLCVAPAGVRSFLDLPAVTGRSRFSQ